MPEPSLLQRLKERKLVQWAVAYLAGAWVLYEASDAIGSRWNLPDALFQGLFVLLAFGFFITLVLAWYHGEKGRQRVSGPELLMVAALLVVAGGVLSMLPGGEEMTGPGEVTSLAPVDDDRPSIAVLPFENYSTDSTYAFFANGTQEQILSTLSDISGLRVISRSSVMQYAENRPNSRQIGVELGASHLVEGSAQVSGGQVRLTVQLIDARTDEHLWSENYDRELTAENLFEVRSEVGQQVAFHVGANLTPNERDKVARVLTDDIDAYLLYLQGNEAFLSERQRGYGGETSLSMRLYEQAIELDPGFALAHARLALSLTYTLGSLDRYERAKREAETAASALPGLPETRVALGRYFLLVGQSEEAKRQFKAAEAETPNMALAVIELGLLQRTLGEFDAGLRTLRRAEALDPRNPVIQRALARSLIYDHRYDEAQKANGLREAVDSSYAGIRDRAWIHLLQGDSAGARVALSELLTLDARGFYNPIPGIPPTVLRRVLSREEHRTAFEAYRAYRDGPEGPCSDYWGFCVRKAIHEQEAGSRELAEIYWDSLRVAVESIPSGTWFTYYKVLIYQGLGEKEAAIRTAENLVSLDRAGQEGVVEDVEYFGPACRILLARILAHFGELDRAIDLLEELLPAPSWLSVPVLQIDPIWDPLRDHPRFQVLLDDYRDDVRLPS